jgi:hypothetical protein
MRRSLVLTNEAHRHPFRQHLLLAENIVAIPRGTKAGLSNSAFFGLSFTGFFVLIMGMIL